MSRVCSRAGGVRRWDGTNSASVVVALGRDPYRPFFGNQRRAVVLGQVDNVTNRMARQVYPVDSLCQPLR